jgi:two-component sensor histidine kinase/putative methionine-R-sulfoxide reductase with GAF domain
MASKNGSGEDQLLARLQEQRRSIESISRIGPEGLSPDRLMHYVTAQVARITHIDRVKVMRYRLDRGDLIVEAGVGWKPGVVGSATLDVEYNSPAGRSIQTGAPVVIPNIIESREFRYPALLKDHDVVSVVNVPVMINGETWGVLEVDSSQKENFDHWDISFLSIAANVMGICIQQHEINQKHIEAVAEVSRQRVRSDMAMRELQHRIKNNLQIIIAFLTLKIRRESSEQVKEKLGNVVARVQAVALAQDMLLIGRDRSSVNFDEYLRSLCGNIDPQQPNVTIEVAAERVNIPIDRAVPAGLVVNELVTNSLKYAFGNGGGTIRVRFALTSNASEGCLTVEDDGKGLAVPPHKGLGLSLVEGFAQQIQGRVEYAKVETGSRIVLCFPVAI